MNEFPVLSKPFTDNMYLILIHDLYSKSRKKYLLMLLLV